MENSVLHVKYKSREEKLLLRPKKVCVVRASYFDQGSVYCVEPHPTQWIAIKHWIFGKMSVFFFLAIC